MDAYGCSYTNKVTSMSHRKYAHIRHHQKWFQQPGKRCFLQTVISKLQIELSHGKAQESQTFLVGEVSSHTSKSVVQSANRCEIK